MKNTLIALIAVFLLSGSVVRAEEDLPICDEESVRFVESLSTLMVTATEHISICFPSGRYYVLDLDRNDMYTAEVDLENGEDGQLGLSKGHYILSRKD